MIDLTILDETIEVVPYDPAWPVAFAREAVNIKAIFTSERLVSVEHYGSTAVPGLAAKPTVDILLGLNEFKINHDEIKALESQGYEFIGQIHPQDERFYARKRQKDGNYNLGIVKFNSDNWKRHLLMRDYLRCHPKEAGEYAALKMSAVSRGISTLIAYHKYKDAFVQLLERKANDWEKGPRI